MGEAESKITDAGSIMPSVPGKIADARRNFGYLLIILAIGSAVATFIAAQREIAAMKPVTCSYGEAVQACFQCRETAFDYWRFGSHTAVTVAFLLYCYAIFAAGERLIVPPQWIRTSEDLRLLLGFKSPASAVGQAIKDTLSALTAKLPERSEKKP